MSERLSLFGQGRSKAIRTILSGDFGNAAELGSADNWDGWTENLQKLMKNNELEKAAHLLACCAGSADMTEEDKEKQRIMFMLPELIPHHENLWKMIINDNRYDGGHWDSQNEVYAMLVDDFGWNI